MAYDICAVAFTNMVYDVRREIDQVKMQLDPIKARALKQHLSVLYVGVLAAPYIEKFETYARATLDSPEEVKQDGTTLVVYLREVAVFDRRSGRILLRAKNNAYEERWGNTSNSE